MTRARTGFLGDFAAGFFGDAFCFAALAASFSRFLRAAASFFAAASSRLRCATSALSR